MLKSLKAKIISTIVTIGGVFTLICLAITSYGWFVNNKSVTANSLSIKIDLGESVAIKDGYRVIGYDIVEDKAFDIKRGSLKLGDYDLFIASRNTYCRRFIRMEFLYPMGSSSDIPLIVTVKCADLPFMDEDGLITQNISNIIKFKFWDNTAGGNITEDMLIPKEIIDEKTGEVLNSRAIYDQCVRIFDNNLVDNDSNKVVINRDGFVDKSFVNVEFDSEGAIKEIKKNDQNEFEVSLLMPSFDLAVPSTDFFIEYNYNDDLVKAFREINKTNYGIKEFEGENTVPFDADITEIKFRLGESDE